MSKSNNGTVLVVDDEAADLDTLFEHLRASNFRVHVAKDGASALESVQRISPDIALLNVNLADMGGFELYRSLKAMEALEDMPIIFLAANEEVSEQIKGLEMGAVDYITKPFTPEEVLARVDKQLAVRKRQAQLQRQNHQLHLEIAELKRWEERNRSLLQMLDTLDGACFIKNKDGIYQYINKGLEIQFSVKREDVIGKDDVFVFGPEIAARLQENDQRIMASKMPEAVEEAGILDDGKFVVYLTNKTPIFDENGEVSGICGVGIDITNRKETEEQLRLSEEKYRVLVEHSYDVVYAVAADGIIEYISPQIALFGYAQEEVIGKKVTQFIAPEQREEAWHSFRTFLRTDGSTPGQFQWLRKDGSRDWVEVSAQNVYDDSGQPIQRVGVMRNITERKQMQEALRKNEEQFRLLVEGTDEIVYSLDADGQFTYVSPQVAQFGYTPEEWIGQQVSHFFGPEEREEHWGRFRTRVKTGDSSPVSLRWLRKDGSYAWVEVSAKTLYDGSGQPVQRIGIMRNITERIQMQETLGESEAMTRALLNASTASALLMEPDGTIVALNKMLAESLGRNMDTLIGRNIFAFLPSHVAKAREAKGKEVLQTGRPARFEDSRADRWFDNHIYPVIDNAGQVKRLAIYATDITERKQAEQYLEQAAVTAERERLARDLHDAVTQSLFMAASIAETLPQVWERKPDEARQGLDQLHRLTMGALAEMRNMLVELQPTFLTKSTLGVLLKQLCDGLMARTQMLVTISVAGDCHLPDEVQIALYRITQEALNNIIKHAQAHRAIVRLDYTQERAQLSIEDNGRGFVPGAVSSDHMGVRNMRERAQVISADFGLDSEPGHGTKIAVTWEKQD